MKKDELVKLFAENLRAERARKNFSQENLAEKANISTEYLSRLESEKYNPTILVIAKLALALDVTIDKLIPLDNFKK